MIESLPLSDDTLSSGLILAGAAIVVGSSLVTGWRAGCAVEKVWPGLPAAHIGSWVGLAAGLATVAGWCLGY